jgi:hypothetical protein
MTFPGQITNGKLLLDQAPAFREYLQSLEGKRVDVTVARQLRKRTNDQNRYYWFILDLISKETGQDPLSLHDAFKFRFSGKITVKGLVIPQSTKTRDTVEFTNYIESIRVWAAEFLNMNIPDPCEVTV